MMMLLFVSENCNLCKLFISEYRKLKISEKDCKLLYININSKENEELCDLMNVWEAPHVKIIKDFSDENIDILFDKKGYFDPTEIKDFIHKNK